MTLRVVALGDSTSCGEGVGLKVPLDRTWPARLARALPGAAFTPLAVAGSQVRDVRRDQLPTAVAADPHLATLLIGMNDVARTGFCSRAVSDDLRATVRALRRSGATVLVGRLHDPSRHLPLPGPLRDCVRARVAVVNAAVDAAVQESRHGNGGDVHVLDLQRVPGLDLRRAWAVDRLHPTSAAHAMMAAAAAQVLRRAGLPVGDVPRDALPGRDPSRLSELWWAGRHGAPWLVRHTRDVLLPALVSSR